jgi:hypothetical protein
MRSLEVCMRMYTIEKPALAVWQVSALGPRLRLVAPGVNGSRTVLAASWTADSAGVQAVLPGGGQLAAGEYIVQASRHKYLLVKVV